MVTSNDQNKRAKNKNLGSFNNLLKTVFKIESEQGNAPKKHNLDVPRWVPDFKQIEKQWSNVVENFSIP